MILINKAYCFFLNWILHEYPTFCLAWAASVALSEEELYVVTKDLLRLLQK